jgi:uncharacterized membrane protein YcaP (DUF421 family)
MLFDGWPDILRIFIVGGAGYLGLIFLLRISGKRTLSKWNAFDFVVTIAFGSVLATLILSKEVSISEGLSAFALLVFLQLIITWLSVRFEFIRKLVKDSPTLLLQNGKFLPKNLKKKRVTESEVRAAIRSRGISSLEEVEFFVLETNGNFSVIKKGQGKTNSALEDVL